MQTTSNECRPLADWLGQSVRFQGYLNYWETASRTGDTAFLMCHVKVVPYKGSKEQIRTLDHIWLYLDKDIQADTKFERYGGYAAVGRVVSYIRSNGTRDYAIDTKSYVPFSSHIELLKSYGEPKLHHIQAKALLLEKTLNLLETEELDFSIHLSYKEIYQHFRNEYEFYHRQVEINQRYEAMKQHRSRPHPDILQFASASSKSTKAASKGFATSQPSGRRSRV